MITVTLSPPTLQDKSEIVDGHECTSQTTITQDPGVGTSLVLEEVMQKYLFNRKKGELEAIIDSLTCIPCNAEIGCIIKRGKWEVFGIIRIWNEQYCPLVEIIVADIEHGAESIAHHCQRASYKLNYQLIRQKL